MIFISKINWSELGDGRTGRPWEAELASFLDFPLILAIEAQILSIVLFAIIKSKFSTGTEFNTASLEVESWGKLCFLYLSDTINR